MIKFLILLFPLLVFAQSKIPNDTVQVGVGANSADKALIFDTNDGASNKKISIEKTTKLLKFDGNSFQLGDGSSVDKELKFNGTSGKSLKYDASDTEFYLNDDVAVSTGVLKLGASSLKEVSNKLYFSENGGPDKRIGSGSGGEGGTPLFTNGSFEDGISTGWSNTGGTASQGTHTNGTDSDTKYYQLIASGSGQYFESTAVATADFMVGGCLAKMDYYSTDASGTWKIQVYDGSSNLLGEQSLDAKDWQAGYVGFKCPTIGTTVKMRVISTASGTIRADHAYLGKENRTFQVAQAKIAGNSFYATTASCLWSRTSTSYGDFPTDADCPAPTIVSNQLGVIDTADNNLPQWTFNNLPAGKYVVVASVQVQGTTTGQTSCVRLTDGTTSSLGDCMANSATNPIFPSHSVLEVTYTSAGSRTFKLQGKAGSGAVQIVNNSAADSDGSGIIVYYFPNDSQTALVPEAQDWFIDASIGGANPGSATASSSYVAFENSSLDLVLNTGSSSAKIPCSSTNAATGLTCSSGSEQVGVVFTPPSAGYYEACFSGGLEIAGSAGTATIQVVETGIANQTISQEGKSRAIYAGATAGNVTSGFNNCGIFYFSSVTERSLKLAYETSNNTNSVIYADRNASTGQRDIHIVVRPLLSAYNRPYLTGDQVKNVGGSSTGILSVSMGTTNLTTACSGTPCYIEQIGTGITSITRSGTGAYSMNFGRTYSKVKCTGTLQVAAGPIASMGASTRCENCSSLPFQTINTSAANADAFGTINCITQD